jgi:hypothetical protein
VGNVISDLKKRQPIENEKMADAPVSRIPITGVAGTQVIDFSWRKSTPERLKCS